MESSFSQISNSKMLTTPEKEQMILCSEGDVLRLLTEITSSKPGQRIPVKVSDTETFLVWTMPVHEIARLSLREAVEEVSNFFYSSNQTFKCLTSSIGSSETRLKAPSFLLVVIRVDHEASELVNTPNFLRYQQDEGEGFQPSIIGLLWKKISSQQRYLPLRGSERYMNNREPRLRYRRIVLSLLVGLILTMLAVAVAFYTLKHINTSLKEHPWRRYTIGSSIGPKYQLQFSHRNISTWKSSANYNPDDWELRLDDQSMIPKALWTDEEERYQQWFRHRYPEKEEVRQRGLYADETFLSDPYAIQVPTDSTFHTAHCVLTLRRYWVAKESGRHLCPRDIDFRHIKHCLDALDSLVFPEGTRGPVEPEPVEEERYMIWKTKVCFDE